MQLKKGRLKEGRLVRRKPGMTCHWKVFMGLGNIALTTDFRIRPSFTLPLYFYPDRDLLQ